MNVSQNFFGSISHIYRFDKRTPWTPHGRTREKTDQWKLEQHKGSLCCAQCKHRITDQSARLEVAGGYVHVFTNPGGYIYEIALFESADCRMHGPATTEYTWFPGHAWQMALCANCQAHLGWRFRKNGGVSFYGLIRDRLIELEE